MLKAVRLGVGNDEGMIGTTVVERHGRERASTDQQLLQQTLLGEAVDYAPFAVFVFDEDRNHVAVNQAACELTGYTRQELLRTDVFALSGKPKRAAALLREVAAGQRDGGRGVLRRKDGTTVPVGYRIGETRIAGNAFYVSVCWAAEPAAP